MKVLLDEDGGKVDYFSCPRRFIPKSVWDYWKRKEHLEKYPHTAKGFDDQDPRYVAFDEYFERFRADYQEMVDTSQ